MIVKTVLTADQVFAYDMNCRMAFIEVQGGGGRGGDAPGTGNSDAVSIGAGGFAGDYKAEIIDVAGEGLTQAAITVGAPGHASIYQDTNRTITAVSGADGGSSATTTSLAAASGASVAIAHAVSVAHYGEAAGAHGGNSQFGRGGQAFNGGRYSPNAEPGRAPSDPYAWGAGGSGAFQIGEASSVPGASGNPGVVVIWQDIAVV